MTELQRLRAAIEILDDRLVDLLAERAAIVAEVWAHKDAAGLPRFDGIREEAEIARLVRRAADAGLDADAVERVLRAVVGKALRR